MKNTQNFSNPDLLDLIAESHQQIHTTVRLIKIISILLIILMAVEAIIVYAGKSG